MSTETATRTEMHTVHACRIDTGAPTAYTARTLADAYRVAAEHGGVIPAADALAAEHARAAAEAAEGKRAAEAEAYARPAERYGTAGNRAVCLARATEHRRAAEALAEAVAEAVTPARWAAALVPAEHRAPCAVDIADARAAYSLAVARERYAYAAEHTARLRLEHGAGWELAERVAAAEARRRLASEAVAVALAAVRTAEAPTLYAPVDTPAAAYGVAVADVVREAVHGRPERQAAARRVAAEAAADAAEAAPVDTVTDWAAEAAAHAARAADAAERAERFARTGWNGRPARAAEGAASARIDAERAAEAARRAARVLGAR